MADSGGVECCRPDRRMWGLVAASHDRGPGVRPKPGTKSSLPWLRLSTRGRIVVREREQSSRPFRLFFHFPPLEA